MILLEVHDGLFSEAFRISPATSASSWRLLTSCDADLPQNAALTLDSLVSVCPMLREVFELGGSNHFEDFDLLLEGILRRAPSGLPWDQLFDDKQLHEVGDVTVKRVSGSSERWKLFQFQKKRTLVRVLWSYGTARKTMLLTHVFVKPGGKKQTPMAELDRAKRILERYLAAVDAGQAQLINAQGGRDGFVKLGH
jgi:hypothetical protein